MIKAFISHSSKQKEFAQMLVDKLGRGRCYIDCYDFEPAYKTADEIVDKIEKSTVFVLLLSKESIQSDWVNYEMKLVQEKLATKDKDTFYPYVIDSSLKLEDIPAWIRDKKCYNLKFMASPYIVARDVNQKFRKLIIEQSDKVSKVDYMTLGRTKELATFENKYYSERMNDIRAMIVSGRNAVGKTTFMRQCMQKMGFGVEYEPFKISLDNKKYIEDFIAQLNSIAQYYNADELNEILQLSPQEKAHHAVILLNELYKYASVFVDDHMSCVLPTHQIAEWMNDILQDPDLFSQLALFIEVVTAPSDFIEKENSKIIHIALKPFDKSERKRIFYYYLNAYDVKISPEDADLFVDKLLHSPEQLRSVAELIHDRGIVFAKHGLDRLIHLGDNKIKPIFDTFSAPLEKNILLVLSYFEFVSYTLLEKIFPDEIEKVLEILYELDMWGVVSTFGMSDEFYRLDHMLSDYIERNKIKMGSELQNRMIQVLQNQIKSSTNITEDISLYFYELRKRIEDEPLSINKIVIPSIAVKAVVDKYNSGNYTLVIQMCDTILNDSRSYYQEVNMELRYWLCSALCREQEEDRFRKEITNIAGADALFLKGFYQRIKGDFPRAEKLLRETLSIAPNMQRARRELVTVLLAQSKYSDALDLAERNYVDAPENTYHIQSYFRCVVRKNIDVEVREIARQLMQEMKDSDSRKREELYAAMDIDYQSLIKHVSPEDMLALIAKYESSFPKSFNIHRAANDYRKRQGLPLVQYKEDNQSED